ncbi:MAG: hypothetical protein CM15mP47_1740 [Methanobacteriota archaeon]|nr:MAG: hypothetical protein CM15mP47_1740 [Euryarchaeota archaeon]
MSGNWLKKTPKIEDIRINLSKGKNDFLGPFEKTKEPDLESCCNMLGRLSLTEREGEICRGTILFGVKVIPTERNTRNQKGVIERKM